MIIGESYACSRYGHYANLPYCKMCGNEGSCKKKTPKEEIERIENEGKTTQVCMRTKLEPSWLDRCISCKYGVRIKISVITCKYDRDFDISIKSPETITCNNRSYKY